MEIILSKQCKSLVGSLGKEFGYAIQRRTDHDGRTRFWGARKSTGAVPPDGHLRFILACAELAQDKLFITDIRVAHTEFYDAVKEAGMVHKIPAFYGWNSDEFLNAREVLKLKEEYLLIV